MKILHVIMKLDATCGGPTRGLANLARAQAERGDDVIVLPCQKGEGAQTLSPGREGNLLVHQPVTDSRLFWYNAALKRRIREIARDRDIVHIHGTWRYHLIAAGDAASAYGIPFIVRPAGNLGEVTRRQKGLLKLPYFILFEKSIFNRASAIHCCSTKELQELPQPMLRARQFIVPQPIRSGLRRIEPDGAELRARCPHLTDENKVILYLGRISPIKRLEVLVDAFIRLSGDFPDWHLILAGPHEDALLVQDLQRRIEAAGLQNRFAMPGMVMDAMKAACLSRADVFAQPSAHENFGLSVAEALLFGLPCVASDGVALAEDLARAGAGIVCQSTVSAFEYGLREMLSSESIRRQYSRAAEEAASRFSPERVAEQLDMEYRKCLIEA